MGSAPSRVEIPLFPGGRRIAFTSSWDDGQIDDRRLVELFNRFQLPATFHLISGTLGQNDARGHFVSAAEVADLYAGHEVAVHTQTHPNLPDLDPIQIADEIIENRKALEDLVGYPVRGMSYPYGGYSSRVQSLVRSLGMSYARTVEHGGTSFPPADPMAWAPTCHVHSDRPSPVSARWDAFHSNPHSRGLFAVWGHGYEIARKDDWAGFENLLSRIAGHDDVWYCTAIQLFDYESARNRICIAANRRTAYNPSACTVTLKADGQFIDVPAGQMVALAPQHAAKAA